VTSYWYDFHWNQTINPRRGFSWEVQRDWWNKVACEMILQSRKYQVQYMWKSFEINFLNNWFQHNINGLLTLRVAADKTQIQTEPNTVHVMEQCVYWFTVLDTIHQYVHSRVWILVSYVESYVGDRGPQRSHLSWPSWTVVFLCPPPPSGIFWDSAVKYATAASTSFPIRYPCSSCHSTLYNTRSWKASLNKAKNNLSQLINHTHPVMQNYTTYPVGKASLN
jgi:hypothetical protein